jgi:integrase
VTVRKPGRSRGRGEGSIYPYRTKFAAYVWVTAPDGRRERKYVYGKTREETLAEWIKLHQAASKGPVVVRTPLLREYLDYWLREIVRPNLKPKVAETYAMHVRLYIAPALGVKPLDKLTVRQAREWLNQLAAQCQCCAQGKDAARPPKQRRCCALGECCRQQLSPRTVADIRAVLRSALNTAINDDELLTKNVVAGIKLPRGRKRLVKPWSVEEARRFLVSARDGGDPMYPAYVLILVLGLRRGEVLGLTWPMVNLDGAELDVLFGLQRIGGQLVNGETKTEASDATLPLPDICVTALRLQLRAGERNRAIAGELWMDSGHVIATADGRPVDPRNFYRSFQNRCDKALVRRMPVHWTRHTCGSLLAALDVHPRVAMAILRHSKIEITMEIYTHIPSELTRKALRKLGDQLDGLDDFAG